MTDLEHMIRGYIICALRSSMDDNYDEKDIHPDTQKAMAADCKYFWEENKAMIEHDPPQAGHDLWLTRNRHGTGFWDREELWSPNSRELTERAHAMGEVNLLVGDDGFIHQFPLPE